MLSLLPSDCSKKKIERTSAPLRVALCQQPQLDSLPTTAQHCRKLACPTAMALSLFGQSADSAFAWLSYLQRDPEAAAEHTRSLTPANCSSKAMGICTSDGANL